MPNKPEDLNNRAYVSNLVGAYTRAEGYTFSADSAVYGGEGGEAYVAVAYTEVAASASSNTMMQSKWMTGTEWMLDWDGLKKPALAKLDVARIGDWAFLRVTEGG